MLCLCSFLIPLFQFLLFFSSFHHDRTLFFGERIEINSDFREFCYSNLNTFYNRVFVWSTNFVIRLQIKCCALRVTFFVFILGTIFIP